MKYISDKAELNMFLLKFLHTLYLPPAACVSVTCSQLGLSDQDRWHHECPGSKDEGTREQQFSSHLKQ